MNGMKTIPVKEKNTVRLRWLFKMAWRDSRRNLPRLMLFMSSITLGIAALVAIYSLENQVRRAIDDQAKILLGADLMIEHNAAPDSAVLAMADTLGDERSKECRFASMIYFTGSKGTRLVQVLALEGEYPFYGGFKTVPADAAYRFRTGQQALVDQTLMLQYGAKAGDTIQVGEIKFTIAGMLTEAPGRTGISTTIAPPVYIPYRYLSQSGLLQKGSRFNYSFYFRYNDPARMERQLHSILPAIENAGWDYETAESRKIDSGRQFDDVSRYLTLIGFIALVLGCIGIASSINIYMREKIPSIAILRCMGASTSQTFLIFLIQITVLGAIAAVAGAVLGTVTQTVLPYILKDILPISIHTAISWSAVGKGIGIGMIFSFLFALLPLLAVRNISPLNTLRVSVEVSKPWRNHRQIILFGVIVILITAFARLQMPGWSAAFVFTAGVLVALLLLAAVAVLLRSAVRRLLPASSGYLWRQGFANLYRPNNQTMVLMVSIGLGALFISTLFFMQEVLMKRVSMTAGENQPNMVLFDIQSSQKEKLKELAGQYHLPVYQDVPIVTMRIEEIKGMNAAAVKGDSLSKIPLRAFEGELRVTYRDTLTDTEKLIAGKLDTRRYSPGEVVPVSLEVRYAKRLQVAVGDSLLFNVQGALISAVVGSLREVDWRRVQTNFRVIFPRGVLEDAPQFHVLVTRVPSTEMSAKFQQAVVQGFPNVSVIDLGLILNVLDDVLDKIGFVIRFMAAFSMVTGLIVLIASVYVSKLQRIRETVLLRTIGASRKQVFAIAAIEYFFLGALAAGTGIVLSLIASGMLAVYSFDASFDPQWLPVLILFFSISLLTVAVGLFNSRGVVSTPPLEVLRKET